MEEARELWTDDNEEKELIEEYWEERAASFSAQKAEELHSVQSQKWLLEIKDKADLRPDIKILDVGCGAGFFSVLLAQAGCLVTAIDLTENMITSAKKLATKEKVPVDFRVMDAEKLAFPDNTFDLVLSRNVTWNLPHPGEAYGEWLRVLKPGGILLNYDGEYAKNYKKELALNKSAHSCLSKDMKEKCQQIYNMLSISAQPRPQWDETVLQDLGARECTIDRTVGRRIYSEQDQFYIATPMFGIKVRK